MGIGARLLGMTDSPQCPNGCGPITKHQANALTIPREGRDYPDESYVPANGRFVLKLYRELNVEAYTCSVCGKVELYSKEKA
jgi:hypothetical protein